MSLKSEIENLPKGIGACIGDEVREMQDDIYYHFSQLEHFEVLRVEQTRDSNRLVLAACVCTFPDPFFKMVVAHTWKTDLAYDSEWHEFEVNEQGTVFRFLTWEDDFI